MFLFLFVCFTCKSRLEKLIPGKHPLLLQECICKPAFQRAISKAISKWFCGEGYKHTLRTRWGEEESSNVTAWSRLHGRVSGVYL